MLKKLIPLLLSLFICLPLLSTQALAVSGPEANDPPVVIENIDTDEPEAPEEPFAVMCEMPGDTGAGERPND